MDIEQRANRPLREVARHLVYPSGIVSTVWPEVEEQCYEWGDTFDRWQTDAGTVILGTREDGFYAATVGGVTLAIPRQVAKTFMVGRIVLGLCAVYDGTRVLWTAHHTRTSTNTFKSMRAFALSPKVSPYIYNIRTANGEQEITFENGSTLMFGARAQGFGRGFDEIDIEVFDEAQLLAEKALEDMVAATNQARHPHGALLFYMGTPPRPTDPGEVFSSRRAEALSGEAKDSVYIECSADPDADPDDHNQWYIANPSLPHRTPMVSMMRLRKNMPSVDSWMREGLGVWDQVKTGGVIPAQSWTDQTQPTSVAVDRLALGVECGPDLACASVALVGQRPDGGWHLELDEDQHTKGRGVAWLVPHLESTLELNPSIQAVVVDVAGPVSALLEQYKPGRWRFKGTKVEVTPVKVAELGSGCARVLSGIVTGWLWHLGQPQLTSAALPAGKRPLGDTGMWVWARRTAESDITPIQAGTLALIGAQQEHARRPPSRKRTGKVVVLQ